MVQLLDGRYRLGPVLGRGGMATVHAARDVRLGCGVAVKLFEHPLDEVALARLVGEARLLASLSHPGLVRVWDVSSAAGTPYLVMDLIRGGTLRAAINEGPLATEDVARLGSRLADTLAYVHSQRIVHRDIKPSNILLDHAGEVYLADFGLAKTMGDARLTATGHCVGTAAYLAPEQVAGGEIGPPADVYSLGLVLLECLTGQPEYTGSEIEAAMARLNRSPRIPARLPPAWHRALTVMTGLDPRYRAAAAECVELLDECLSCPNTSPIPAASVTTPTQSTRPAEPARQRPRLRISHAAAALLLVAATTAVGTFPAGNGNGADPAPPTDPAQQAPTQPPNPSPVIVPRTTPAEIVATPILVTPTPQQSNRIPPEQQASMWTLT